MKQLQVQSKRSEELSGITPRLELPLYLATPLAQVEVFGVHAYNDSFQYISIVRMVLFPQGGTARVVKNK
jgi:hypothetical protein